MRMDLLGPVPPPTGGIATHMAALALVLRNHGHDVRIHDLDKACSGRPPAASAEVNGWASSRSSPRRSIMARSFTGTRS